MGITATLKEVQKFRQCDAGFSRVCCVVSHCVHMAQYKHKASDLYHKNGQLGLSEISDTTLAVKAVLCGLCLLKLAS